MSVFIYFGFDIKAFVDRQLKDKRGKLIIFNSVADVLSSKAKRNWELIHAFGQVNGDLNETV